MKLKNFCFGLLAGTLAAGVFAAEPGIASLHGEKGVACEACHGPDKANPTEPTTATCTGCHDVKALVAKTAGVKPNNPHTSPHYQDQLDCTNCHRGHEESENFCNQCHNFDFKVK